MPHLLQILNPQQKQAVMHQNGPLLIIAGAGTGKTNVITYKIAWLIEQKLVKPDEILALTFTDKASQEMEERVDKLLPYGIFDMWISTFHSFCQRILENHALDIGISPDYRLLNQTETWLLMRKNLYKFNLDYYRPHGNPSKFIHALLKLFSRLKDENITADEYLKYAESLMSSADNTMSDESVVLESRRIKETAESFYQYQQIMLDNNFLDFGDLIYYANKLFVQRPNILQKYQKQFKYILIDEFQDTNLAQYQLIKILTNMNSNLTVVGDDDQAIFKFRGASVSNILNFKKDFPKAKEIVLTKNYRSGQNILDTAYKFIQNNNPDRLEYQFIDKKLYAQTDKQGKIDFIKAIDGSDEVNQVIKKIKKLLNEPETNYNDIAILLRANRAADLFTEALEREKLPFIYLASAGLFQQQIIIDLLSYARILADRADSVSLSKILTIPGLNIDTEDVLKINYWAKRKTHSLFETLENIRALPNIKEETVQKIENLISKLKESAKQAKDAGASEMLIKILNDTQYREHLIALEQQNPAKTMQCASFINQLLRKIKSYTQLYNDKSIKGFIEHIDLEREAGDIGSLNYDLTEQGPEAIKILTIHSAKGLEFKYVFIVNMVQQRFPTNRRSDPIEMPMDLIKTREILPQGDGHLQEERRLFYVALTRAKQGIFLTAAQNYGGKRNTKPSQFLLEAGILKDKNEFTSMHTDSINNALLNHTTTIKTSNQLPITNYQLPKEFSYSQIAAFRKCPLQYRYQFILKIPQDKGKGTFSFGQTLHSTMLEIFKRIKMRASSTQTSLFEKMAAVLPQKNDLITLDEIYQIYQQKWIDDWYDDADNKKHYYKAGKKILKEFYECHQNNWPVPLYLEKPFHINLDNYILKGRIDRIDKINDNKGIEIIDYKTSLYKEKLYSDDKTQLLIYQIALENNDSQPQKLTYYYLNDKKQGAVSFIGKADEINKTKKNLIETIEQIKQSDFPAKPSEWTCKYCDFKNICAESKV
ncbi:MAG: UvrD-helicase domain-containing protein [Candidatus Jacksonbacteria bacterium]